MRNITMYIYFFEWGQKLELLFGGVVNSSCQSMEPKSKQRPAVRSQRLHIFRHGFSFWHPAGNSLVTYVSGSNY